MSSTYTGTAGNVTPANAVDITEPSDGDALNAASVNTALSELADYTAFLKRAAYDGDRSVKKLLVDGVGNVANAGVNGTLTTVGDIQSTGGNIGLGAEAAKLYWPTGYILGATKQTTNETATTVLSLTLPTGKNSYVEVVAVGRKVGSNDVAIYRHWWQWQEVVVGGVGGATSMADDDIHAPYKSDAAWGDPTMPAPVSGMVVPIKVTGKTNTTINWAITVTVTSL